MLNHFDMISDDEDLLADAISIAMRSVAVSALTPPAIGGWRIPEDMPGTLRLHVGTMWPTSVTYHPCLMPMSAEGIAPMVQEWLRDAPRPKISHDYDVVYNDGWRVEAYPFDLDIVITAVELEYHK